MRAAGRLRRHWPFSRVALGILEIQGVVTILVAQMHIFWAVVPLIALWQGLGMLFTINTTSLRQTVTPNHLLGRVVATAASAIGLPLAWQHGGTSITLGYDRGLPVAEDYTPPFPWNGALHQVEIDAGVYEPPPDDIVRIALQVD